MTDPQLVLIQSYLKQLRANNSNTLTVAANAMGFVTAWLTEWPAYDRAFLDRFGLAPHEKIAGFVHIGRGTPPEDRVRPVMAEIVSRFEG